MTDDPLGRARAWAAVDPDPAGREALEAWIERAPGEVAEAFAGRLEFGTAGIRGPLGVGPQRMNRVLVRSVAAAIARRVLAHAPDGPAPIVVIGYDARHGSDEFAADSARVLAAHGIDVVMFDGVAPTPLVPFAVGRLGARAGVVVTASHNPAADAGYKVYWHDGAQIVPPVDGEISAAIDEIGLIDDADLAPADDPRIRLDDGTLRSAYAAMAAGLVPPPAAPLRIVYTPVHGVGAATVTDVFARAGHAPLDIVAEQAEPDPDFPTAPFPNPEEPGVLDPAFEMARAVEADLVLANDPDADRVAVGVPTAAGWQRLTGDDVGALLGDHLLSEGRGDDRLVVTTIVSSRLLGRLARHHGVHFATTLTGFKWIVRPGFVHPEWRFVFGYEEALGYAVTDQVPDKDGITAALVVADLAARLAAEGKTLVDRLHDLGRTHGIHRTGQRSIRFGRDGALGAMREMMGEVRADPPSTIAGRTVEGVTDLADEPDPTMRTDALIYDLADGSRIVVRPSGTEPKVKIYVEVVTETTDDAAAAFAAADADLADVLETAAADLGLRGS